MTDIVVFDFVTGKVLLLDRSGDTRDAPDVLELTAVGAEDGNTPE